MLSKRIVRLMVKAWHAVLFMVVGLSVSGVSVGADIVGSTEGELRVEQGTMYYSIPLALPKGVAGMEPELSLNYSSMGGNGPLGLGWSLGGVSQITRCPKTVGKDGVKAGIKYNASDRYCLDGQRLVAISGGYGKNQTEYRTEMNGHSKVVSYGQSGANAETGPDYFKVWTKAGQIIEYSAKKYTHYEAGEVREVHSWRVSKISDTLGNHIDFMYTADKESHLQIIKYATTTVQFYYEQRPDQTVAYDQGYLFNSEQRLDHIAIYDRAQLFREYRLQYQEGGAVGISQLVAVSECFSTWGGNCLPPTKFAWMNGGEDDFTPQQAQGISLYVNHLGSFSRIHYADFNGDGRVDVFRINSWLDKDHGYQSHRDSLYLSNGDGSFETIQTNISMYVGNTKDPDGVKIDLARIRIGDFNGDGNADIYRIEGGGDRRVDKMFLSNGDGTFTTKDGLNSYILWGNNGDAIISDMSRFLFADFDGDGRTDLYEIREAPSRDVVHYANDRGTFTQGPGGYFAIVHQGEYPKVRVGDFNGDGMADVFKLKLGNHPLYADTPSAGGKMFLAQGQGKAFHTIKVTMEGVNTWRTLNDHSDAFTYSRIKTGDFNGDGRTDFYYVKGLGSELNDQVYLSRGNGSFAPPYSGPKTYVDAALLRGSVDISRLRLADFNGDGRTDVYRINGFHSAAQDDLYLSKGIAGFIRLAGGNIYVHDDDHPDNQKVDMARVTVADFSGDGRPDIYRINGWGHAEADSYWENQTPPALIHQIENGLGAKTNLSYKPLTDDEVYAKGRPLAYHNPVIAQTIRPAQFVVASRETDNGIGGLSRLSYQYESLIALRNGREESLGFYKIITHDETANKRLILSKNRGSILRDNFPFNDEEISTTEEVRNEFGEWQLVKSTTTKRGFYRSLEYQYNDIHVYEPRMLTTSETLRSLDDPKVVLKQTDTAYFKPPADINFSQYDEYGNPLFIWTRIKIPEEYQTFITETSNTYQNDDQNWILGRLTTSSVRHSVSDYDGDMVPKITRRSKFIYDEVTGLLTNEIIEPDSEFERKTVYTYDGFGNKVKTSVTAFDDVERIKLQTRDRHVIYDFDGRYAVKTINALEHSNEMTYHSRCGGLETTTDPNRLPTSWRYDDSCRKIEEVRADGTWTRWDYQWVDPNVSGLEHSVYKVTETASAQPPATSYYDKLGRVIRQQSMGFDGRVVNTDTQYDALGRVARISLPYYADESYSIYWTETRYDHHNRIIELIKPALNGGTSTEHYDYGDYVTVLTDAKGHKKTTVVNVIGQTVRVEEETGSSIEYEYDAVGNLTKNNVNGIVSTIEYDLVGNKITMTDPDMGQWQYRYNGFGELVWQQDAKGQVVELDYDLLGRLLKRSEAEGTTRWQYDTAEFGIGKLARVVSPGGYAEHHIYDDLGRPVEVKTAADNRQFSVKTSYDEFSRVSVVTRPQNFKVENVYNDYGFLAAIRSPKSQIGDYSSQNLLALYEQSLQVVADLEAKAIEYEALVIHYRDTAKRYQDDAAYYTQASAEFVARAPELLEAAELLERLATDLERQVQHHLEDAQQYEERIARYEERLAREEDEEDILRLQERIDHYTLRMQEELDQAQALLDQAEAYRNEAHDKREQVALEATLSQTYLVYAEQYTHQAEEHFAMANEAAAQAQDFHLQAEEEQQVASRYQAVLNDQENVYFWRAMERDAAGRLISHLYGNGVETHHQYDQGTGWLTAINSHLERTNLRELEYDYDALGNVILRKDHVQGVNEYFNYDRLNRLIDSTVGGLVDNVNYSHRVTYEYDIHGNLTYKSDVGEYLYGEQARSNHLAGPHAITAAGVHQTFIYDENGSLVFGAGRDIQWASFNKPKRLEKNGKVTRFAYGPDRARFLKVADQGTRTVYIGKLYEYELKANGDAKHKHFVYADGRLVAIHSKQVENSQNLPDETRFIHVDNLASVDTITDIQGQVERLSYEAFGERRAGNWRSLVGGEQVQVTTNRGYTGHEHLDDIGLIHMNGRVYDPELGRFISADPFVQAADNSQSYNRYSYVWNNPMTYTDSTGHFVDLFLRKRSEKYRQATGVVASVLSSFFTPAIAIGNAALNTAITGGNGTDIMRSVALTSASIGIAGGIGAADLNPVFATLSHGISQGAISRMGGGSFHSGFWSGFLGHAAGEAMGDWVAQDRSAGAKVQRAAIAATVGGTASYIGGGKFGNGAVTAAFVHMFNTEDHPKKVSDIDRVGMPMDDVPLLGAVTKAGRLIVRGMSKLFGKGGDNVTKKEVLTRKTKGGDGGTSQQIIERDESGNVISRTHKVTTDGKTVHQHQNNVGKEGGVRQFPDEWTGTKTIDAPYDNIPPKFPADRVPGGKRTF